MWRVMSNAVATKAALFKKKCAHSEICPVCEDEPETLEHMLLLCPWANRCWFGCSLSLRIDKTQITSFRSSCEEIFLLRKEVDEKSKALVAAIFWGIWKERCGLIFNEEKFDAEKVVTVASLLVNEVWNAKSGVKRGIREHEDIKLERKLKWELPLEGEVKINIDGAFVEQNGSAGIGVGCRNSNGRFVGGFGKCMVACSAFQSECFALREALHAADRFSMQKVTIEMDCEVLFRHLMSKSGKGGEWQSEQVLSEILKLAAERPEVEFSLVARQGNNAADCLAAMASKRLEPNGWLETAPTFLREILLADVAGLRKERQSCLRQESQRAGVG